MMKNVNKVGENYGTSSVGGMSMNSMKRKYERGWKNSINDTSFMIDVESEGL